MSKIGIDARFYSTNFTGIGRYTAELINNLAKIDQENQYFVFLNRPQFEQFNPPGSNFQKVLVNASHYSLKEQSLFLLDLLKYNLDLMHFTHFNAPIFYNKPSLVTIHDLTLEFYPGKKMSKKIHRLAYQCTIRNIAKKSKHIFAVSQNTANDINQILKIPKEKITVTYNGIGSEFHEIKDSTLEKNLREKYNLDKPFLLYTGVWRTHKNLVKLIQAFKLLREKYQKDVYLVLTGKKDNIYTEIPWTINSLDLENSVKCVGLVPESDLLALYNFAEGYVFPSLYEGFGFPPLEAMACGTPVASSFTSSLPEICGEAALFFDPQNINDLAEKMNLLLSDSRLRSDLRQKGFKQIQNFKWKNCAQKTFEIYKNFLN